MARKKFKSYYELNTEMAGTGLARVLDDAEEIEMMAARRRGTRANREKIQETLLGWFNAPAVKGCCDLTTYHPPYCMIDAMKKKYNKIKRRK